MNKKKNTILVCDDDREIVDAIEIYLSQEGYRILKAYDGVQAVEMLEQEDVQLLLIDIMMPKLDGLRATLKIREKSSIPIIILSAKSEDADKILGLNIGADDYVTKPFNPLELVARVKSQLRRYQRFGAQDPAEKSDEIRLENLYIEKNTHSVKAFGNPVRLTHLEFEILYLLASHPGKVFSTDEIFETVWKEKSFDMSNTVMVHIRRLREKLEGRQRKAQIIKTVWGVGYKIEA